MMSEEDEELEGTDISRMRERSERSSLSASDHGIEPDKRDLPHHLRLGMVLVDKPRGPTSHQVSAWVKGIFGLKKAGHSGTLDPNVSGVLPIVFEDGTRALDVLLEGTKEYVAVLRLHGNAQKNRIKEVFVEFLGEIYQTPPVRAAVKRELRIRKIHSLEILEMDGRSVLFKVVCDPGTYIRTLCTDIGEVLGVGGHMLELRRTRSGHFKEAQIYRLHELKDAFEIYKETGDETQIRKMVMPMERLFDDLPKITIKDSAVDAICHGANVALPGIVSVEGKVKRDDLVVILTQKGEAVGLGIAKKKSAALVGGGKGVAVDIKRVFMAPGTYPRLWKRKVG